MMDRTGEHAAGMARGLVRPGLLLVVALVLGVGGEIAFGQGAAAIGVESVWRTASVQQGDVAVLAVKLHIPAGWHVNVGESQWDQAAFPGFTPLFTEIKPAGSGGWPAGVAAGRAQFPRPSMLKVEYVQGEFPALVGEARIYLPVRVGADVQPGKYALEVQVSYQACTERTCMAPRDVTLRAELQVAAAGADVGPVDAADFAGYVEGEAGTGQSSGPHPNPLPGGEGITGTTQGGGPYAGALPRAGAGGEGTGGATFDFFGHSFVVGGTAVVLLIALVVGVLLNFTPCVLPVVPLKVLSLHQQAGDWKRSMALGLTFSAGIIAAFAVLGLLAAGLVGAVGRLDWGQQFGYWPFTVALGLIVGAMGLGMMGLFTAALPQFVYRVAPRHDTHAGSFMFGVLTAALSTPCTGPMMAGALAWAARQPAWLGLLTFVVMGAGMALPYLILVANPKWVDHLPRTGPGSVLIKEAMGGLLLAVAVYFFGIAGKPIWGVSYWWAVAAVVGATGAWLAGRTFFISRRVWVRGVMTLLALGAAAAVVAIAAAVTRPSLWRPYEPAPMTQARGAGKTVVLEFTADWCLNCKALELAVFSDPQVSARLQARDVACFRVDLTSRTNKEGWQLFDELGMTGIPLTAVYRPGAARPELLTSIYTKAALLGAMNGAGGE
jgi:thiol:disulfide interchange protein DsbD